MNKSLSVKSFHFLPLYVVISVAHTFFTIYHVLVCCLCCVIASLKLYLNWSSSFWQPCWSITGRLSFYTAPQFRYMCAFKCRCFHSVITHTHTFPLIFVNMHQGYQLPLCLFEACILLLLLLPVMLLSLSISCLHRCCAVSLWFGSVCRGMKGRGSHTDGAEVSMVMYCRWAGKSSQLARKRRGWRVRR